MARPIPLACAAALLAIGLVAVSSPASAAPSWQVDVTGSVHTGIANGQFPDGIRVTPDASFFPPILGPLQVPSVSARASLTSQGAITYAPTSGRAASPQTSGGQTDALVTIGALRATGTTDNNVSDYVGPAQLVYGSAGASAFWIDTLTFHTSNPLGVDFLVSLSFDDSLSTALAPSLTSADGGQVFPEQTSAFAQTDTSLSMVDAGGPSFVTQESFLSILDSASRDADQRDPLTGEPLLTLAPPSARVLTTVIHVFDNTAVLFWQRLYFDVAVQNGSGHAAADATAWINLIALDDGASYSAASGAVFAAEGNPLAPVPEPSELALIGTGLGVLAFVSRRRRRTSRA